MGAAVQVQTTTNSVRFEWIRGRTGKRPINPRRASGAGSPIPGSSAASKSNGALQPTVGNVLPPSSLGPGLSSPNPSRTSLALSATGASENNIRMSFESRNGGATETEPSSTHETDADEEVDPEDSEVPWMCYVVRSPPSGPSERSLIGTLSPAPHHPKGESLLPLHSSFLFELAKTDRALSFPFSPRPTQNPLPSQPFPSPRPQRNASPLPRTAQGRPLRDGDVPSDSRGVGRDWEEEEGRVGRWEAMMFSLSLSPSFFLFALLYISSHHPCFMAFPRFVSLWVLLFY